MKFFKPDLLERFGSSDDAIADAAHVEWEQSCQSYREASAKIAPLLPPKFVQMLDDVPLHDARFLDMNAVGTDVNGIDENRNYASEKGLFFLELRSTDQRQFVFSYEVPLTRRGELLVPDFDSSGRQATQPRYWLYDEVEMVCHDAPVVFLHRILLSDSSELAVPFSDFRYDLSKAQLSAGKTA